MRSWAWLVCLGSLLACSDDADTGDEDAGRPASSLESCTVRGDRDGDGVERRDRTACEQLSADERTFPLDATEDCDDENPDAWYGDQFYTDEDGDGFGAPNQRSVWGCADEEIEGFAPNADDCDDADATRHEERFEDQDDDRFGAGAPQCVAHDEAGFVPSSSDCDDESAQVWPAAPGEQPLDGVDSNCDGSDYPWFGAPVSDSDAGMPSWPEPLTIPEARRCQGRGLSILALEVIEDCGGGFRLQIGNPGDQPATGRVLLTLRLSGGRGQDDVSSGEATVHELPEIGAGEVVRTELLRPGQFDVELMFDGDPGSCTPNSDSGLAWGPFVDCF